MGISQPRECNKIFEELAKEPNDIVGLLAYGIYKREKIEHIKRFIDKNQHSPSDEDLRLFHDESMGRVAQYRKIAAIDVQTLYNEIGVQQGEAMFGQMVGDLESTLKELRPRWWLGVWQGAVGSLVFTIGLFILLMLAIGFFDGAPAILDTLTRWLTKLGAHPAPPTR